MILDGARRRIAQWLTKGDPVWDARSTFVEVSLNGTEGDDVGPTGHDLWADLRVIGRTPWVTAAARATATYCANVPRQVIEGEGDNATPIEDHWLLDLLDQPQRDISSGMSGFAMWYWGVEQLEIHGNAFVAIEGGADLVLPSGRVIVSMPDELHPLHAAAVTILRGKTNTEPVRGYRFKGTSRSVVLPAHRVIHVRYPEPDPRNPLWGRSLLDDIVSNLVVNKAARDWLKHSFENGLSPSGVIEAGGMSETEYRRFVRMAKKRLLGPKNAKMPLILEGGAKWQTVSSTMKDAQMTEQFDQLRDEQLATMGTPATVVGLTDAPYANSKEQHRIYFQQKIMPVNGLFAAGYTHALLADEEGKRLDHDYGQVEALQKDRLQEAQTWEVYERVGAVDAEFIAAQQGFPKPKPKPVPVVLPPMAPGQPGQPPPPSQRGEPEPPEDQGDDPERGKHSRWLGVAARASVVAATMVNEKGSKDSWMRFLAGARKDTEARWFRTLDPLRREWEARVLSTLRGMAKSLDDLPLGVDEAKAARKLRPEIMDDPAFEDVLRFVDAWFAPFEKMVGETFQEGADWTTDVLLRRGVTHAVTVNTEAPALQSFLKSWTGTHLKLIERSQREVVRRLVEDVAATGGTVKDLETALGLAFDHLRDWEIRRIAVTETTGLIGAGAMQEMKDSGIEEKMWVHYPGRMGGVREDHLAADGQVRKLDEDFQVGDASGPHPGALGGGHDINCECAVVPVIPPQRA